MVVFLALGLGGCAVGESGGPRDQVGNPIPAGPVTRVVALAPDVTEIVFALSAGRRLVAVPPTADFPPEVLPFPRVNPANLESILAYRPDVVLATTAGNDPRIVGRLVALGVRTCTVDPTSLERIAEGLELISRVLAIPDQGEALADSFRRRVQHVRTRARGLPPKRGLYVAWWEPLIVAGPGTFHHDLLSAAGIVNLAPAGAGRYPRVNPEVLLDPRLELLVAPEDEDGVAGYQRLASAIVGRRLHSADLALLWLPADPVSRPGPRILDALEQLVEERSRNGPLRHTRPSSPPGLSRPSIGGNAP